MTHTKEIERCRVDFIYWAEKYACIPMRDRAVGKIKLFDTQRVMAFAMGAISSNGVGIDTRQYRQRGNTTIVNLFTIWVSIFGGVRSVKVVSANERQEQRVLKMVADVFDLLPEWMRNINKVVHRNKSGVWFENGSSITTGAKWESCHPALIHFDLFDFMSLHKKHQIYDWLKSEARPRHINFICIETGMPFLSIVELRSLLEMLVGA